MPPDPPNNVITTISLQRSDFPLDPPLIIDSEIPANGTLDILLQAKSKFKLNIIDISAKYTQCQIILRIKLKNTNCCDIRSVHDDTSMDWYIQLHRHLSAIKDALKETPKNRIANMVKNFTSRSVSLLKRCGKRRLQKMSNTGNRLSAVCRKIFTILLRDTSTTLYRPSKNKKRQHVLVEKNNEQSVQCLSKPPNTATRSFLL